MHPLLDVCETWFRRQYQTVLGVDLGQGPVRLRWLDADAIGLDVERSRATALAIEDADIGWLLFMVPYATERLEKQVSQAVCLRSRLLREANYTGSSSQGPGDDQDGSWRVGLVWIVPRLERKSWQDHIQELRRESGVAEEISLDAIWSDENEFSQALDEHGMPRLLFRTRALMRQCQKDVETWASADTQVLEALGSFGTRFGSARARTYAREIIERARAYRPTEAVAPSASARSFTRFVVKDFRNLQHMGVVADPVGQTQAQAIILCGPNGTGKSSFAEAVCLAAFGTSPRLEAFMADGDLRRPSPEVYLAEYLRPSDNRSAAPRFIWGNGSETDFRLSVDGDSRWKFDGVILNQEDSRDFTAVGREELASRVLKGYSGLADSLMTWLNEEEGRAKGVRQTFARKNGLAPPVHGRIQNAVPCGSSPATLSPGRCCRVSLNSVSASPLWSQSRRPRQRAAPVPCRISSATRLLPARSACILWSASAPLRPALSRYPEPSYVLGIRIARKQRMGSPSRGGCASARQFHPTPFL